MYQRVLSDDGTNGLLVVGCWLLVVGFGLLNGVELGYPESQHITLVCLAFTRSLECREIKYQTCIRNLSF